MQYIGNCTNEELINELFDSVSNLALLIERNGDEFEYYNLVIQYDIEKDIHSFYIK
jgi:hypothetical protein